MVVVDNKFGCNRVSGCSLVVSGGELNEGGEPCDRRVSGGVRNPKLDNATQDGDRSRRASGANGKTQRAQSNPSQSRKRLAYRGTR